MTYEEILVGQYASFTKTITETDVYSFAGITGDFNPIHINRVYAQGTRFGKPIVHGMLISSLFSTVFCMKLPGEGAIYISQDINFKAPVFIDDTITATVTVLEKSEKGRVLFKCTAFNQDDRIVVDGSAVLIPLKNDAI